MGPGVAHVCRYAGASASKMNTSRKLPLAALLLLAVACGRTQSEGTGDASSTRDAGSSTPRDASHDAQRDTSVPMDTSVPVDSSRMHADAEAHHDGGARNLDASILDTGTDVTLPPDGSGCIASCTSDEACGATCTPAFLTSYCCDMTSNQCFVNASGGPCPLNGSGCPDAGCPSGEMCVFYLSPELYGVPSCYALPAACASNPSCPCLADAGVCGAGEAALSCADAGGASITCAI
jgi:hypothetical protein